MRKPVIHFLVSLVVFSGISLSACKNQGQDKKTDSQDVQKAGEMYVCPMHPEETSDKPGVCPKCGMDLVKKSSGEVKGDKDTTTDHHDTDEGEEHDE